MTKNNFTLLELWSPNETYSNHRIPGMIVSDKGTLLAYCEARKTSSDWAMMDILLFRSEDHGKSFGTPVVLAHGTEIHKTVNNPVMMQDKNGRIHFLYCEDYSVNGGRVLRRYSDDDGITWSEVVDITSATMSEYRNAFALGPGHGILTKENVLVVPIWMVPKHYNSDIYRHTPSVLSTLYSKDNGETWQMGDVLDSNNLVLSPNETVLTQTSDGRVYLNGRHLAYYRIKAYSDNGYSGWTEYGPEYQLPTPQCFSSVASFDDGVNPYTIIYVGCASKTSRTQVTVFASTDDGKTFSVKKLLDNDRGGYADVAVDNKERLIYVLYEDNWGTTDYLAVFGYDWLVDGE